MAETNLPSGNDQDSPQNNQQQQQNNPPPPPQTNQSEVLQTVLRLLSNPAPQDAEPSVISNENTELRGALSKMAALLRDRNGKCIALDKKVDALTVQVNSLKEVVALTKDLLNIRNMELEHLKIDMNSIQGQLDDRRQRHDEVIKKLDGAINLNEKLKAEYEKQLKLFQDLKERYYERSQLLEATPKAST